RRKRYRKYIRTTTKDRDGSAVYLSTPGVSSRHVAASSKQPCHTNYTTNHNCRKQRVTKGRSVVRQHQRLLFDHERQPDGSLRAPKANRVLSSHPPATLCSR